ncbi:MAG: GntR family transcriptional regulator [Caulobacteraceae bacterium]
MRIVYSMQLGRPNISEAAADAVRAMIVDGRLPDGERINEVRLAEQLGVSRTPLREALNRLSAEGALTSVPRIGYFVRPLTLEEFQQIYAIRPLLDPEALRLAGVPTAKKIERLRKLNESLRKTRKTETAIALDDQWHLALISDCPNRVLIELIENIIVRTKRYELALLRDSLNIARATDEHAQILDVLQAGDLEAACKALRQNMESGFAPLVEWLKRRETSRARVKR